MTNVDFENRSEHVQRGGNEKSMAPTIRGKIEPAESGFLVEDYLKAKKVVPEGTTIVVTIPGPMTVMDTIHDSFYNDDEALARDIVAVLRKEAELLIAAGVEYISVDEPVWVRYPDKVEKWGVRMVDELVSGLDCYWAVHCCCSYPTCPQKADCGIYQKVIGQVCQSQLHAISIEYANKEFDLEPVLAPLNAAGKSVILGVCRLHNDVESVELIKSRAKEALEYIAPTQLILAPDCGLVIISRESAKQKMSNITQAVAELNKELGLDTQHKKLKMDTGAALP